MKRPPVRLGGMVGLVGILVTGCGGSSTGGKTPTPEAGLDSGKHDASMADAPHGDTGKKPPVDGGHTEASQADSCAPADTGAAFAAGEDAGTGFSVPASWNQAYCRPSDSAAAAARTACTYKKGMMPAQTLGPSTLLDSDIPIEHIIVLMQENRSFDSYLGHLQAYETTKGINNTIESAPTTASNPAYPAGQPGADAGGDAGAQTFPWKHATALCSFDTNHTWGGTHIEYDKGRNDGFYFMNNGQGDVGESIMGIEAGYLSGERAMWWYDQTDIPFHYALYSTFAMADHYHSALLGPTYPNRDYLYSGTSFGITVTSAFPDATNYPFSEAATNPFIIFDELTLRNITWKLYAEGAPGAGTVLGVTGNLRYPFHPVTTVAQFMTDAMAGNLPAVSFVDGNNQNETTTGDDEHPPSEIEIGQHFVWEVVNAVTTSPNWKNSVLFITYDENGGFYDHVDPPPACEPDNIPPNLTTTLDQSQPGSFNQYGFRVPFVAVSPYSKKNYVSHTLYSHTSITRFIEAKAKIPAMTNRDANEDPFTDLFDWQNPPFMTPPTFTEPTINQTAVTACTAELTAAQ